MTAGIPGSGVGGVFYMLLVLLMPLRELCFTFQGRSSLKRWMTVMSQWLLCTGMLAALWGEAWLLKRGYELSKSWAPHAAMTALTPVLALAPFAVLGLIVATVHLARWLMAEAPLLRETGNESA